MMSKVEDYNKPRMLWYDLEAVEKIAKSVKYLREINEVREDPRIQNAIEKLEFFNKFEHVTGADEFHYGD